MIVADLHIHSRFSRATAKNLDPEHLWIHSQLKGVDLVGTGDCTHAVWLEELEQKLEETGDGAYTLKQEVARTLAGEVPGACARPVRFVLSGEISSIYKRHGQTRKVHSLILPPDLEAARRINARLERIGNLHSDGRPILGLDARDLLELCLEAAPDTIFIPAHIWTPWFSLFGSKSGFNAIEDCFGDLTRHIHALETGLSSDPPMNWRLSALDRFNLVSHSDAHSPGKLAREADLFECEPTFPAIAAALADREGGGLYGTLEFFPDEGKYHLDGHRKCGVRLSPEETRQLGGICPKCGRALTVGVLNRVDELADRPLGYRPENAKPFESLVPLNEVIAEIVQKGPNTKGVLGAVERLLSELGPELFILRQAPLDELERLGGPLLSLAIQRMRQGQVVLEGGYDGEFGVVRIFSPQERREAAGQKGLWSFEQKLKTPRKQAEAAKAPAAAPKAAPSPATVTKSQTLAGGLNPEQATAASHMAGHLIVQAGPGSGKTRLLVERASGLLEQSLKGREILMITFTRKAAAELRERLAARGKKAGNIKVSTFHALGREIIQEADGTEVQLISEELRGGLIKELALARGVKPGGLDLIISNLKQRFEDPADPDQADLLADYQAGLDAFGFLDLDDLVRQAVRRLQLDPRLYKSWQSRFKHICVDEYQDVNPVQVELLRALAGPGCQVAAIGDPDQAIYGFRGADSGLFMRFEADFPGASRLGLTRNYRSAAPILDLGQALLAADETRQGQALRAMRADGPIPLAARFDSPQAEAAWIAQEIVSLLGGLDSRQVEGRAGRGSHGYAAMDIAVLYRVHALAGPIQKALEQAGVPVQVAARQHLAELDPMDFRAQRVSLLSMHAAKGLEWPVVFIAGLERGVIPFEPPGREPAPSAEERRLLYVAMTRAEDRLYLSHSKKRMLFGQSLEGGASPFWAELPADMFGWRQAKARPRRAKQLGLFQFKD